MWPIMIAYALGCPKRNSAIGAFAVGLGIQFGVWLYLRCQQVTPYSLLRILQEASNWYSYIITGLTLTNALAIAAHSGWISSLNKCEHGIPLSDVFGYLSNRLFWLRAASFLLMLAVLMCAAFKCSILVFVLGAANFVISGYILHCYLRINSDMIDEDVFRHLNRQLISDLAKRNKPLKKISLWQETMRGRLNNLPPKHGVWTLKASNDYSFLIDSFLNALQTMLKNAPGATNPIEFFDEKFAKYIYPVLDEHIAFYSKCTSAYDAYYHLLSELFALTSDEKHFDFDKTTKSLLFFFMMYYLLATASYTLVAEEYENLCNEIVLTPMAFMLEKLNYPETKQLAQYLHKLAGRAVSDPPASGDNSEQKEVLVSEPYTSPLEEMKQFQNLKATNSYLSVNEEKQNGKSI